MAAPTFTALNGQIKTPWRWYDAERKLTQYQPQCKEELEQCSWHAVISANTSLPPFQFPRPSSVLGITSWKLYDKDGNEMVDLAADIAQLEVIPFYGKDYVVYSGGVLSTLLPPGTYYSRIATNGATYYSEPVQVACDILEGECFDPNWRNDDFYSTGGTTATRISLTCDRVLSKVISSPGDPTDPALQYVGSFVANGGDSLLYTWNGSAWVSSTPPIGQVWWWNEFGIWLEFTVTGWDTTLTGDPPGITTDSYGLYWYGSNMSVEMLVAVDGLDCACAYDGPVVIQVVIEDYEAGSVQLYVPGNPIVTASANGTYSVYIAGPMASYSQIIAHASAGFIGGITAIRLYCQTGASACYRRLTWTNCGNVGTTYYAGGFVQELWLRPEVVPLKPTPTNRIESEEQADGSLVETFRRKEVRYELQLGMVPWHVADALSDLSLMDTVRLYHLAGDGSDTLTDVKVEVIWNEERSECMPEVRMTFLLDAAAVACCDAFDKPCVTACAEAGDFVSNIGHGGTPAGNYISDDAPSYEFWDGGVYSETLPCNSGCIDKVTTVEEGQPESRVTYLWNIALEEWQLLAYFTTSDAVAPCSYLLQAIIAEGYRAVLQYATADTWIDVPTMDFSADEWASNTVVFDSMSVSYVVRLKVYLPRTVGGDCVIGYSGNIRRTCS